jgi:hypothetical protein
MFLLLLVFVAQHKHNYLNHHHNLHMNKCHPEEEILGKMRRLLQVRRNLRQRSKGRGYEFSESQRDGSGLAKKAVSGS